MILHRTRHIQHQGDDLGIVRRHGLVRIDTIHHSVEAHDIRNEEEILHGTWHDRPILRKDERWWLIALGSSPLTTNVEEAGARAPRYFFATKDGFEQNIWRRMLLELEKYTHTFISALYSNQHALQMRKTRFAKYAISATNRHFRQPDSPADSSVKSGHFRSKGRTRESSGRYLDK